jgi:transcriptional regulator with XRE-family HTH domain
MTDVILIRSSADWIPVFRSRIAELGLSHLDVDGLAGLSEGHTSKILCGLRKPTADTIARLCGALGLVQTVTRDAVRKENLSPDGRSSFAVFCEHSDVVVNKTGDVDGEAIDQLSAQT